MRVCWPPLRPDDFISSERSPDTHWRATGPLDLQSVRPCAWWERLAVHGSKDGGTEGGAVLRAVLWKSEQRQQCLRVSRQTY